MNRRNFLKGTGLFLGAPAFCKADWMMDLWVPKQELVTLPGISQHVDSVRFIYEGAEVGWRMLYEGEEYTISRITAQEYYL